MGVRFVSIFVLKTNPINRSNIKIIYNISIPIELRGEDRLYWDQRYTGVCDVLVILIHFNSSGTHFDNFVYVNPGEGHDICDNTKKYTIPNDSFGGSNRYIIVQWPYYNIDHSYTVVWKFWIERDIVENLPSDTIRINIIILISRQIIKRGIKNERKC